MNIDQFWMPFYSPKLARVKNIGNKNLHSWLKTADFTPEIRSEKLRITAFDLEEFLACWANDTTRLLIAGRDTLSSIDAIKGKPQSTAWILIKLYYAAFYYAHVVLRLTRTSLTYTTTTSLMRVKELIDIYGIELPFPLKTNQYVLQFTETPPEFTIEQKSSKEGTHENTWKQLEKLVLDCKSILELNIIDNLDMVKLNEIYLILKNSIHATESSGKLLSTFRNEIQYTQMHGVWPPYGSTLRSDYCIRSISKLKSSKFEIKNFDMNNPDKATSFLNCCLLICWSAEIFIANISKNEIKSFLRQNRLGKSIIATDSYT